MPPDARTARSLLLGFEERYPEFASCQLANEVAMIYGWGRAVDDWSTYCDLREMLSHAAS